MTNAAIEQFIDDLMKQKGVSLTDPVVLAELKLGLMNRAQKLINATILEHLPEDKIEEFSVLVEGGDQGKIQQFCEDNIVKIDTVVAKALLRFQTVYLNAGNK